jgi:hypothetical protein
MTKKDRELIERLILAINALAGSINRMPRSLTVYEAPKHYGGMGQTVWGGGAGRASGSGGASR